MSDDAFRAVHDELTGAAERIEQLRDQFEDDPARVLADLTWVGLMLAQRAQAITSGVIVEPEGENRFLSLPGLLCGPTGAAVTIEPSHFTILRGGSRDQEPAK